MVLAILYGAFGSCVWYLHEAIVDAVYTSIGAVSASGSFDSTYGGSGSAADDAAIADGERTIRTQEQTDRLASSPKRGARGGGDICDDPTAMATTVTESTASIKNTRTSKQVTPSSDEDSDGSYELV